MNANRVLGLSAVFGAVAVVVALMAMVVGGSPGSLFERAFGPVMTATKHANADPALRLYADALTAITRDAMFASPDRQRVVAATLSAYLSAQDPYSGLMTREQYAKYRAVQTGPYGGVGMDLERLRDGTTRCYPYARGPAENAGIRAGDRLVSIDGTLAAGKPLPLLAALATGPETTQVMFEVANAAGETRRVSVTRARMAAPQTEDVSEDGLRVIRIASFTTSTRTDVELALRHWQHDAPIVIDLRGCGGGDFYAAVDTAMLFLDKGAPIVTVTGRHGAQRFSSTSDTQRPQQPVFIWQSISSASAAEIFIGALTGNARAVSIGTQSAGKGSRQDIVELKDGSALVMTTGYLTAPPDLAFNARGLAPMRPLAVDADTAAYVRATRIVER